MLLHTSCVNRCAYKPDVQKALSFPQWACVETLISDNLSSKLIFSNH